MSRRNRVCPRVVLAHVGFNGAGWDVVDGVPVIVLSKSLSERDRSRYLAAALADVRARFRPA